jgi:hypothetical protein
MVFFNNKYCLVSIDDYPNIRSKSKFSGNREKINFAFDVNLHIEEDLGDLNVIVEGGESNYTFVKQDKSKNKDYLIKTEK